MKLAILDRVGSELAEGRYRISSRIGDGNMGQVYRAFDRNLGIEVVLKFPISPDDASNLPGLLERFARESQALIHLSHPHVVKILDIGEDYGLPFVVMPYLEGGSLKNRFVPLVTGEPRPMPPEMLHGWLPDIARALDFIHGQGHVHGDVKPANILFDRHGNAFVADFGVVRTRDGARATATGSATPRRILSGTPNYLAPELIQGSPGDGRGDQYALAITVHEALLGWNCMEGATPSATMLNHTKVEPPRLDILLKNLPTGLADAVARGLSKLPDLRYPSCALLAKAILENVPPYIRGRSVSTPRFLARSSMGDPGRLPCPRCGGRLPVVRDHAARRITCSRCRSISLVQIVAETLQLREIPQARREGLSTAPSPEPIEAEPALAIDPVPSSTPDDPDLVHRRKWIQDSIAGLTLLGIGAVGGWQIGSSGRSNRPPVEPGPSPSGGMANPAPLTLKVVHPPALRGWLDASAKTFQAEVPGLTIELVAQESLEGLGTILDSAERRGGRAAEPHLWIASAPVYRNLLDREWSARSLGQISPVTRTATLASSPLAVVLWKERHEALRQKLGQINLLAIENALAEPEGWGALASRPGWGSFRLGMADPIRADSGLMMLALLARSPTESGRALERSDLNNRGIQARINRFLRGLARPGGKLPGDSSTLVSTLLADGPSRYDGVIAHECQLAESLETLERQGAPIHVLYPEPNLSSDFVGCVLRTAWVDEARQDLASRFVDLLLGRPSQVDAARRGLRPSDPNLTLGTLDTPLVKHQARGFNPVLLPQSEFPSMDVIDDLGTLCRRLGHGG